MVGSTSAARAMLAAALLFFMLSARVSAISNLTCDVIWPGTLSDTGFNQSCLSCYRIKIMDYSEEEGKQEKHVEAGCDESSRGGPGHIEWSCDHHEPGQNKHNDLRVFRKAESAGALMVLKRCCNDAHHCNADFDFPHYRLYLPQPPKMAKTRYVEMCFYIVIVLLCIGRPIYLYLTLASDSDEQDATRTDKVIREDHQMDPALISEALPQVKLKEGKKVPGCMKLQELSIVLATLGDVMEKDEKGRRSGKTQGVAVHDGHVQPAIRDRPKKHQRSEQMEESQDAQICSDEGEKASSKDKVSIVACELYKAVGNGHVVPTTIRKHPSLLDSFLLRLIEHGPYQYEFKPLELMELFDQAKDIFAMDPLFLKLQGPIFIIGDIRGRYVDLHRYFQMCGWPPFANYLFLGGILDEGEPGSLECIALIASLKIACPKNVFLIRGIGEMFNFAPFIRMDMKRADAIGGTITRMCASLPVAAMVDGRILCVYSGISPQLKSRSRLPDIARPTTFETMPSTLKKLLFSEPSSKVRMYRAKPGSKAGDFYGGQAVKRVCRQMGIELIIRARNPLNQGCGIFFDRHLISLWSAPGKSCQRGAILSLEGRKLTVRQLEEQRNPVPLAADIVETRKAKAPRPTIGRSLIPPTPPKKNLLKTQQADDNKTDVEETQADNSIAIPAETNPHVDLSPFEVSAKDVVGSPAGGESGAKKKMSKQSPGS